ncbi:MAG: transcription antitermination factor NusB [Defluviitaleaceae bacterium]|nr:transcription antitermination factor NusB [Defluviitaleaceae bacterium]
MSRKNDRKHALCLVFTLDFNVENELDYYAEKFAKDAVETGISELGYVQTIVDGVKANMNKIDNLIDEAAEGWEFKRLSKIDKAIMRVCVYEIIYMDSVSAAIAINEAVELAKEYSTDEAPKFINGIVSRINRNLSDLEQMEQGDNAN